MRIAHVITRLIIGGAQENTLLTCEGLRQRGHEVTLIAGPETGPEGSLWDEAERSGYRLIRLESLRRSVRPWHDWRSLRTLRRTFRELKCDVVHTHSSKAGIVGRRAASDIGVPVIVHTIHGMSFNRTQPWWIRFIYRSLERNAAHRTHGFITVAEAMIEQSVAAGIAPRGQFTTIRSGMRMENYCPDPTLRGQLRREWSIGDDEVVVGTVARLFRNKGYESILKAIPSAVADFDRLRFVWVGDGAHREMYLTELARMGLRDRVILTGLVTPRRVAELMNGFDILLHASEWEGLPRAVVQGSLMGIPVISYDNDGAPEVVRTDETGELVRLGDTEGLSRALVRLAADPDRRRRLGAQGRALCLEQFDHRRMVDQIEAVYVRLAKNRLK